MCANRPVTDEERAAALAPIPTAVPPMEEWTGLQDSQDSQEPAAEADPVNPENPGNPAETAAPGSPALAAMGYKVKEDGPLVFSMALETPFEGASIRARLSTYEDRQHYACVDVHNARGLGWNIGVFYHDMGRSVAKSLLRTLAIEVRRAYCHRSRKIAMRAAARAILRDRETVRPSDRETVKEAANA